MGEQEFPLINILIRTSNRPSGFMRLLNSITSQSYPNIRIIVGFDNYEALRYIPKGLEIVYLTADKSSPYWYDLYLNDLKELVDDGYFVGIDDDDFLISNTILDELPLSGNGLICQLQRGNNIVPIDLNFKRGMIGMPCIFLHHSLKNVADFSPHGAGDYYFIKAVLEKHPLPFIPKVVVYSPSRGLGRCNG